MRRKPRYISKMISISEQYAEAGTKRKTGIHGLKTKAKHNNHMSGIISAEGDEAKEAIYEEIRLMKRNLKKRGIDLSYLFFFEQ